MLRLTALLLGAVLCVTASAQDTLALNTGPDTLTVVDRISPEHFLARGNAFFEAGDPGRAILAYERGLRLRPGHRALSNNLDYVRQAAGILRPELPEFFLRRWWRWLGSRLGSTGAFVLAVACWWFALAGVLYWYLRRRSMEEKRRFALLPAAGALLLAALVFFLMGKSRRAHLVEASEAIVIGQLATLRVAPVEQSSVEAELGPGHKVTITDRPNPRFVKVRLDDGRQGYLPVTALETVILPAFGE